MQCNTHLNIMQVLWNRRIGCKAFSVYLHHLLLPWYFLSSHGWICLVRGVAFGHVIVSAVCCCSTKQVIFHCLSTMDILVLHGSHVICMMHYLQHCYFKWNYLWVSIFLHTLIDHAVGFSYFDHDGRMAVYALIVQALVLLYGLYIFSASRLDKLYDIKVLPIILLTLIVALPIFPVLSSERLRKYWRTLVRKVCYSGRHVAPLQHYYRHQRDVTLQQSTQTILSVRLVPQTGCIHHLP